jgi:hypothetical protein
MRYVAIANGSRMFPGRTVVAVKRQLGDIQRINVRLDSVAIHRISDGAMVSSLGFEDDRNCWYDWDERGESPFQDSHRR